MPRYAVSALLAATVLFAASGALAHARLVKSDPAADATVAAPKAIRLTFNEKLIPSFCGVDLSMSDGMKAAVKTSVSADGKTLIGAPQGPLMAGAYILAWHAAAADDGHRTDGKLSFTVR